MTRQWRRRSDDPLSAKFPVQDHDPVLYGCHIDRQRRAVPSRLQQFLWLVILGSTQDSIQRREVPDHLVCRLFAWRNPEQVAHAGDHLVEAGLGKQKAPVIGYAVRQRPGRRCHRADRFSATSPYAAGRVAAQPDKGISHPGFASPARVVRRRIDRQGNTMGIHAKMPQVAYDRRRAGMGRASQEHERRDAPHKQTQRRRFLRYQGVSQI